MALRIGSDYSRRLSAVVLLDDAVSLKGLICGGRRIFERSFLKDDRALKISFLLCPLWCSETRGIHFDLGSQSIVSKHGILSVLVRLSNTGRKGCYGYAG